MSDSDILVPISNEQLLDFINVAKRHLPQALRAHHFLLSHYRLKKSGYKQIVGDGTTFISIRFCNQFYTHRNGNIDNCTFIGVGETNKDDKSEYYVIFIFSLELSNNELRECMLQTNKIKWENNPLITSMQINNFPALGEVVKAKNLIMDMIYPNSCFYLPKEIAKTFSIHIPSDVEILPLRVPDADIMNDMWPHKDKDTDIFIRTQVALCGGLGIFERGSGRLLSWICNNDNLAASTLQTLDTEKRKGYGEIILKAFCKQFAEEENLDIIGYVIKTNTASQKLFRKLGFIEYDQCFWIFIKSRTNT